VVQQLQFFRAKLDFERCQSLIYMPNPSRSNYRRGDTRLLEYPSKRGLRRRQAARSRDLFNSVSDRLVSRPPVKLIGEIISPGAFRFFGTLPACSSA
jgi:hypothetical protein